MRAHFDGGDPARSQDVARLVEAAPPGARFYACGPAGLLDAFARATEDLPPGRAFLERFRADAPPARAAEGFTVELARDGRSFAIRPGESILDVLLDAGLDLPFSCQEGICGQCVTRVLAGAPEHRDSFLSPAEKASGTLMTICVSGCRDGRLTLDV